MFNDRLWQFDWEHGWRSRQWHNSSAETNSNRQGCGTSFRNGKVSCDSCTNFDVTIAKICSGDALHSDNIKQTLNVVSMHTLIHKLNKCYAPFITNTLLCFLIPRFNFTFILLLYTFKLTKWIVFFYQIWYDLIHINVICLNTLPTHFSFQTYPIHALKKAANNTVHEYVWNRYHRKHQHKY